MSEQTQNAKQSLVADFKEKGFAAFLETSARVRFVFSLVALASAIATAVSLGYVDYFAPRESVNQQIIDGYKVVNEQQGKVVKIAADVLPSVYTEDQIPTDADREKLRKALIDLSVQLSGVLEGSDLSEPANQYRSSIAEFMKMLVLLNENNPTSYSNVLLSALKWDAAAKKYKKAVEERTGSYFKTLLPSA